MEETGKEGRNIATRWWDDETLQEEGSVEVIYALLHRTWMLVM